MKKKSVFLIISIAVVVVVLVSISIALYSSHYHNNQDYARRLNTTIENGDIEALKMLLKSPGNVNSTTQPYIVALFVDAYFKTPLQAACYEGNLEMVKLLIDAGADVNYVVPRLAAFSPLMYAAGNESESNLDIVKLLVEKGARGNYSTLEGRDALREIVDFSRGNQNSVEIVKQLELAGANIKKSYRGESILHMACGMGNSEIIRYLVKGRGFNVNDTDNEGYTSLMRVCLPVYNQNKASDVRYLLDHGADRTIVSKEGKTAYDYAYENNRTDFCEILEEYYPTDTSN